METEHTQKARFAQLVEYVRSKEPDCIPMAAGACRYAKNAPIRMHHADFRRNPFRRWKRMDCL